MNAAALRDDILAEAGNRFEQRLGEECAKLRGELEDLKHELKLEIRDTRLEIRDTKADLIKWCFVFWVGQFVGVAGLLAAFVE